MVCTFLALLFDTFNFPSNFLLLRLIRSACPPRRLQGVWWISALDLLIGWCVSTLTSEYPSSTTEDRGVQSLWTSSLLKHTLGKNECPGSTISESWGPGERLQSPGRTWWTWAWWILRSSVSNSSSGSHPQSQAAAVCCGCVVRRRFWGQRQDAGGCGCGQWPRRLPRGHLWCQL